MTIESTRGRFSIPIPVETAKQIRPGQRILTADYLYKICYVATQSSFRKATDSINMLLDRKGTSDELSVSTFANDVILAGRTLIEYKMQMTASILSSFGFDPATGLYPDGILPAELRNQCCTKITLSPAAIANMSEEEWTATHPMSILTVNNDGSSTEGAQSYSQPDMQEFVCPIKRRSSRVPVPPEKVEQKCKNYINWINGHVEKTEYGILHSCSIEIIPKEVLYIMIDAVMVKEQVSKRIQGGKQVQKTETTRIKHWNIRIETECGYYAIISVNEEEAYKELIAFILRNQLYNRYFIFFIDGENCIFEAIKHYFVYWEYEINLDWFHCSEKIYTLLSSAIYPRRIPDPRAEERTIKQGKNKGKSIRKKISLSRLYGRALERILWFGNVPEAIEYIRHITQDDIQNPNAIDELIKYLSLENKGKYIANSGVRKKAGLRNSSNGVEGQNMVTIADRQKDDDMFWCEYRSAAMGATSTLFVNHEEEEWFYERRLRFTPHVFSTKLKHADSSNMESNDSQSSIESCHVQHDVI